MDVNHALLVAIMFITLLAIGISNIVVFLAGLVDKHSSAKADGLHTSWVVLLLLMHLNLFWHVLDILAVETWRFPSFLYIVAGAILIFFATNVLLPDASREPTDLRGYYFDVSRRFFGLLALLMVWIVGVDFLLGNGWTSEAYGNVVGFILFVILALTSRVKVHGAATVIAVILFAVVLGTRGSGVVE